MDSGRRVIQHRCAPEAPHPFTRLRNDVYTFASDDPHANGPLIEIQVHTKDPNQPPIYKTEAFYDLYDRAFRAERGAVVNTIRIANNGYRGMQLEMKAGPHAPGTVRIFSTAHREYIVQWNPTMQHAPQVAETFLMPQGSTQP